MEDRINEHFGLGPVIFWRISPTAYVPAVREAQVNVPSEMLAIRESRFLKSVMDRIPGGQDDLRCGLKPGSFVDPVLHGKNYNQLWCDGHVSGMSPSVLFNPTNTAPMWNYDHEPHPEMWMP
jgi:prepilin-type processing-associated H-X9-DG protein